MITTLTLERPQQLFTEETPVDLAGMSPADARVMMIAVEAQGPIVERELDLETGAAQDVLKDTRAVLMAAFRAPVRTGEEINDLMERSKTELEEEVSRIEQDGRNQRPAEEIRASINSAIADEAANKDYFAEKTVLPSGEVRFMAECLVRRAVEAKDSLTTREAAMTLGWLATNDGTKELIAPVIEPLAKDPGAEVREVASVIAEQVESSVRLAS